MDDQRCAGLTLIELLIALSVLAILVTGVIPAMSQLIERQRLTAAAETIAADLRLLRNAAMTQGINNLTLSFQTGKSWCYGAAQRPCNCHAAPKTRNACTLTRNPELAHFTRGASDFPDIRLIKARFSGGQQTRLDNIRGLAQPGTLRIANRAGDMLDIKLSLLGRIRICTPSGQRHRARYEQC